MKAGNINKEIGGRIRELRKARGLSMRIAYQIRTEYGVKVDPSYLSRIERGRVEIPLRTICAMADFYDVSPGWLIDPSFDRNKSGIMDGVEYLFDNPEILNEFKELGEKLGTEIARDYIRSFLSQILSMLAEPEREKVDVSRVSAQKPVPVLQSQKSPGLMNNSELTIHDEVSIKSGKLLTG